MKFYLDYKNYYMEALERYPRDMVIKSLERKIVDFSKLNASHIDFLDSHIEEKLKSMRRVLRELVNED